MVEKILWAQQTRDCLGQVCFKVAHDSLGEDCLGQDLLAQDWLAKDCLGQGCLSQTRMGLGTVKSGSVRSRVLRSGGLVQTRIGRRGQSPMDSNRLRVWP